MFSFLNRFRTFSMLIPSTRLVSTIPQRMSTLIEGGMLRRSHDGARPPREVF